MRLLLKGNRVGVGVGPVPIIVSWIGALYLEGCAYLGFALRYTLMMPIESVIHDTLVLTKCLFVRYRNSGRNVMAPNVKNKSPNISLLGSFMVIRKKFPFRLCPCPNPKWKSWRKLFSETDQFTWVFPSEKGKLSLIRPGIVDECEFLHITGVAAVECPFPVVTMVRWDSWVCAPVRTGRIHVRRGGIWRETHKTDLI